MLSISGLTFHPSVSYVSGGYVTIGTLVVVNIRLQVNTKITAGATGTEIITGFPTYNGLNRVAAISQYDIDMALWNNGNIVLGVDNEIGTGTLIINAYYVQ